MITTYNETILYMTLTLTTYINLDESKGFIRISFEKEKFIDGRC